jgi:hypothetical protein
MERAAALMHWGKRVSGLVDCVGGAERYDLTANPRQIAKKRKGVEATQGI